MKSEHVHFCYQSSIDAQISLATDKDGSMYPYAGLLLKCGLLAEVNMFTLEANLV